MSAASSKNSGKTSMAAFIFSLSSAGFPRMEEDSRPLLSIAVLVSGVVGGLAVVITVVYFYKFCLKKRPALSTTGKPEWKREVIRSTVSSQCRPLPLPLLGVAAGYTQPTTLQRAMREVATETEDLILRTMNPDGQFYEAIEGISKVAHVFPMITREFVSDDYTAEHTGTLKTRAIGEKVYLSVQPPSRTHSEEVIQIASLGLPEEEEMRRASFDAPRNTGSPFDGGVHPPMRNAVTPSGTKAPPLRNTGRLLPSQEHLEMAAEMTKERKEVERAMKMGSVTRARRMSTFNRSNAVHECPPSPVKQISSPLPAYPPSHRSLYDRDHEHARSWNPGVYELEFENEHVGEFAGPSHVGRQESVKRVASNTLGPNYVPDRVRIMQTGPKYHSGRGEDEPPSPTYCAAIVVRDPLPPPPQIREHAPRPWDAPPPPASRRESRAPQLHHQNTLAVKSVPRQAASFDERRLSGSGMAMMSADMRSASEAHDDHGWKFVRQSTIRHLEPQTEVSFECQNLWQARRELERLNALGISDPSSASTSFESNTDGGNGGPSGQQQGFTPNDSPKMGVVDARTRRSHYRSLLTQRRYLSAGGPMPPAISSFESSASSSSYQLENGPVDANFASSVDSAELERRRLSLMNCDDGTTRASNIPAIATSSRRPIAEVQPVNRGFFRRDFSVDQHADTLFREFTRQDPPAVHRHTAIPIAEPLQNPLPLIMYPESHEG